MKRINSLHLGNMLGLLLLLGALLGVPKPVYAQGPTIFDIVKQVNPPSPTNYSQFIMPNATGYATGPGAAYWLRSTMNAASGWSYAAANGWQFAVTDWQQAPKVAEVAVRTASTTPYTPSQFAPSWGAFSGYAFMQRMAAAASAFAGFVTPYNSMRLYGGGWNWHATVQQ